MIVATAWSRLDTGWHLLPKPESMGSTEKKSLIQQMTEVEEEHQRRMEEKDRAFKVRIYLLFNYLPILKMYYIWKHVY